LAVALAEAGFPNGVGMKVELSSGGLAAEYVLFGEDASRVVISCDRNKLAAIQPIAVKYGLTLQALGETVPEQIEMSLDGRTVVSAEVEELSAVFENALEKALRSESATVAAE
jgi:phosphoribosylformylglycinamidine (FGAM) synthase-like enzyme